MPPTTNRNAENELSQALTVAHQRYEKGLASIAAGLFVGLGAYPLAQEMKALEYHVSANITELAAAPTATALIGLGVYVTHRALSKYQAPEKKSFGLYS